MNVETPLETSRPWERVSARRLFERKRRDTRGEDGTVTAFRDGEVTLRSNRRTEGFTNAIHEHGYQGVRVGDLVIHSMDGFAGAIGVSDSDGKASPVVHCYRPNEDVDARYYAYMLRDLAQRGFISSLAKGIRERSTAFDSEAFRSLRLPVPPLAEQRAIADYLDAETARIDALIAKKQQLIHLLEERHNLAIAELALGRLYGARDLRSSKVEWIGQIPAGWEVRRLNRIARLESGHTPSRTRPELWERADKHWITLNDVGAIKESEYIEDTVNRISAAGIAASSARMLPADTVVLSRDATVGRVGIMKSPMATSQHFAAWVCSKRLDPRFLWLLMRFPMQRFFNQFNDGATLRTIGMPHIRAFVVPLAPLETQHQIVATAERQREDHQQLRSGLHRQVILLSERRQALVTAAVTGEFAVPGGV